MKATFGRICAVLDRGFGQVVSSVEKTVAWWRATFPKWFRFIFYCTTMIGWAPVLIIAFIPIIVIGAVVDQAVEAWRDF